MSQALKTYSKGAPFYNVWYSRLHQVPGGPCDECARGVLGVMEFTNRSAHRKPVVEDKIRNWDSEEWKKGRSPIAVGPEKPSGMPR